jgi:hypothetical protein
MNRDIDDMTLDELKTAYENMEAKCEDLQMEYDDLVEEHCDTLKLLTALQEEVEDSGPIRRLALDFLDHMKLAEFEGSVNTTGPVFKTLRWLLEDQLAEV